MKIKELILAVLILCVSVSCASTQIVDGRDGSSFEKAVVIVASGSMEGVQKENEWLSKHYRGYRKVSQSLSSKDGKPYDVITIKDDDGNEKTIYFDISKFYGRL